MMHPEDDLKNLTQLCIIGQQVASGGSYNDSFKFKYSECTRLHPFICVKPLSKMGDRCASFRENLPGGNWLECDRMLLNDLISESQMCCMYNVNLKLNFNDSNAYCARFDSQMFSSKLIGYKSILESYASYLNLNFLKQTEYSNFWTSCQSDSQKLVTTCVENKKRLSFDFPIKSGAFEIVSVRLVSNNKSFLRFNITNIFEKLEFLSNKSINFNLTTLNQTDYDESWWEKETNPDILHQCLKNLFDFMLKRSLFLVKRNVKFEKLQLELIRTRGGESKIRNENMKCFSFYQESHQDLIHLSLPLLNKCFHLTLKRFSNTFSPDLFVQDLWGRNDNLSNFSNSDLPLKEINADVLQSILDILGITHVECLMMGNQSVSRVLAVGKIIQSSNMCLNLNQSFTILNITGLNRLNKTRAKWMKSLTSFLSGQENFIVSLHSFSYFKKILHLSYFDSFPRVKIEVRLLDFNINHLNFGDPRFRDHGHIITMVRTL